MELPDLITTIVGSGFTLLLIMVREAIWDFAKSIFAAATRAIWSKARSVVATAIQSLKSQLGFVVLSCEEYDRLRKVERAFKIYIKVSDELRASTEGELLLEAQK